MIRQECIEEINKYILSARIQNIYNADFVIKQKDDEDTKLAFPSFEQIVKYVNGTGNIDKFFENLSRTLENYNKFINSKDVIKQSLSYNPLIKRIELSHSIIEKLLGIFDLSVNFEPIKEYKILKCTSLSFSDDNSDAINFLFDSLKLLFEKVKKYVKINSIYSSAYKVDFENNQKLDKDASANLNKANELVKKIIDKKYIPDFLSDGSEDLREMMGTFWNGFYVLLNYSKPSEAVYFECDGKEYKNIKDFFKNELDSHYLCLNALFSSPATYEKFDDATLRELYDKLQTIKVPKELNPRSESELLVNKGKAELKLASMIGLDTVKDAIEKIKAAYKANKGKKPINLHMTFSGNPGTGKTEVGKLMAEILFENGILPTKKFVYVTRKDLVSPYYGGDTAERTQNKMAEAMGGVLFVDEAYDLVVADDPHDYGHQAVAELLTGMENNLGKFSVIFAGYTNKLQKMIDSNDGFDSRIGFKINFPNYTREEMSEIMQLLLDEEGYIVDESVLNRMLDISDVMRKDPKFANARVARNIISQCIMCQNTRRKSEDDVQILIEDVEKYISDAKLALPKSHKDKTQILTGMQQLEQLIGLDSVKTQIKKFMAYTKMNKGESLNMHMAFLGAPGTGKSEVAKIISRILFEAGMLSEAKTISVKGSELIGQYKGVAGIKTHEKVQEALGGVLFIDEAYELCIDHGTEGSFGDQVVTALVDDMEDYAGKFCLILAGYEKDINKLIASNKGMDSRLRRVYFENYSKDELKQIALMFLSKKDNPYTINDDALEEALNICMFFSNVDDGYANARTLREMLNDIIMNQALRVDGDEKNRIITIDDVNAYAKDKGLVKRSEQKAEEKKKLLGPEMIEYLNMASFKFDATKADNNYFEEAVICISGEDGGQGTGFIIAPNGFALTCNHCLSENGSRQKARVILPLADGQKLKNYLDFDVLYRDEKNDFALIKLEDTGVSFKFIPLTFEKDVKYESLQEFIMAGYPFGGETYTSISITEGKVASVNDFHGRKVVFADMFGKPGNSGSPVIDKASKKVIGVYWGGITDPHREEMINCFTPLDIVWEGLKNN